MAARRQSLIKKTIKKPRVSRSESYLINLKYMGEEPEFLGAMTEGEFGQALNWYNCMCDKSEAKEYTAEYLKKNGRLAELKAFKAVPDVWVSTTVAWVCRMYNRGYELPLSAKPYMERLLAASLLKAKKDDVVVDTGKQTIQDRMRERQSEIIGDIEEMIDKGIQFSLYDWLKANEIPASYATPIAAYYSPIVEELIAAYEGKDPQLKEGYAYLGRKGLKARIEFFHGLVEDASRYGNVTKKTRAPRKPRPVSVEKVLKNFKFQKEDNTHRIASMNPEKILGAQELWCFNTKYKTVTVFRALDRGGLQVKGTTIACYDEKTSMTKSAGRKPEEVLDKIQKGGKIVLKKMMDELKTSKDLQTRINENTVLMKVVT